MRGRPDRAAQEIVFLIRSGKTDNVGIVIGTKVSHYSIVELIGRGGMGEVYRAHDERLGRDVALKFLPHHMSATSSAVARFMSEARAASALDHRNICTIFDIGSSDSGRLFIAMAYYEGQTLDARLAEGRIPVDEALSITRQIAEGLSAAHEKGIVHRDVKPSNVMITDRGVAKLLDFGIAKVATMDVTAAGATVGTAAYMSPEQTRGDYVDHRTDIFSLGVVAYEMICGARPFRGDYEQAVLYSILNEEPRPVDEYVEDAPVAVARLLDKMLAKEPESRAQSMTDVIALLDACEAGFEPEPAPVSEALTEEVGADGNKHAAVVSERRKVTVLYGDLAATLLLSRQLDAEDYSELVGTIRDRCAKVVQRFEGQFVPAGGTGFFAYFGYPKVFEDNVGRAVRSGLGILDAIKRLPLDDVTASSKPQLKLGIHSGLVVTNTTSTSDVASALVGATPEISRWVQHVAEPGCLFVSDVVFRSVANSFAGTDAGEFTPEDGGPPMRLYRVEHESAARVRLRQDEAQSTTPLMGRERELAQLTEHWSRVCDGEGEVVLLSGEAGIGKSRIARAIAEVVATSEDSWLIQCQCSPYYTNSSLYPIVEFLEHDVFDFQSDESPADRLDKIEGFLVQYALSLPESVPLLASLLSVPLEDRYEALPITPEKLKTRTLQLIVNIVLDRARSQPVLLVVEDLHWADPTTLELLDLIVDQGPTAPVLSLLTFRPTFSAPWSSRSHASQINLRRLGRPQVTDLIRVFSGGLEMPSVVVDEIISKSDGIPLVAEELTKSVLESDMLRVVEGEYRLTESGFSDLQIPDTLQDSLMARLDRLGDARQIVQIASTIGREFSFNLLRAVAGAPRELIEEAVSAAVRAEFLYQRGTFPEATLIFKHALIQDAAYASLVKGERRAAHSRIAKALVEQMPDRAQLEPELLAYHYTRAGMADEAVPLWLAAGRRDFARSANVESQAHLEEGLRLLATMPETPERDGLEIVFQLTLGFARIATKGYASSTVEEALHRARELCIKLGSPPALFPVLWGLWAYYIVLTDFQNASDVTAELVAIATESEDSGQLLQSHTCSGMNHFWTGDLPTARTYFESALAIYDPELHGGQAVDYLQNPAVVCHAHLAWSLWMLGVPERASFHCARAIEIGREVAHPYSLGYALAFGAVYCQIVGNEEKAIELATECLSLSTEQGFPIWRADANMILGWAAARKGNPEGMSQLQDGLDLWNALGARLWRTHQLALKAEILGLQGRPDEGLAVIEESFAIMRDNNETYYAAELHRIKGELMAASKAHTVTEALHEMGQALRVADEKQQRGWRLRTLMSLCMPQQRSTVNMAALDQLQETIASFDMDSETPDLAKAKSLISELT